TGPAVFLDGLLAHVEGGTRHRACRLRWVAGSAVGTCRPNAAETFDEGVGQLITVGIVDCLQPWTLKKRAAYYLKVCEPQKATVPPAVYGRRFLQHFEEGAFSRARICTKRSLRRPAATSPRLCELLRCRAGLPAARVVRPPLWPVGQSASLQRGEGRWASHGRPRPPTLSPCCASPGAVPYHPQEGCTFSRAPRRPVGLVARRPRVVKR
ncbi:unnamed protein product, partial [Prorocentrum cordatum]